MAGGTISFRQGMFFLRDCCSLMRLRMSMDLLSLSFFTYSPSDQFTSAIFFGSAHFEANQMVSSITITIQ
jgi:hypothetical protein